MNTPPKIIAHRGFSAQYPENTLTAFQAAKAAGADGVETDLQLDATGKLRLFHDDPPNPPAPRLTDLLPLIDAGFILLAEIKLRPGISQAEREALLQKSLDVLQPHLDNVLLLCFDSEILQEAKRRLPSLRTVLNVERADTRVRPYTGDFEGLFALSPDVEILDENLVARARERGLKLATWTVNTLEQLAMAQQHDVDFILGDDPVWLRAQGTGDS